jgi:hypothetical protein
MIYLLFIATMIITISSCKKLEPLSASNKPLVPHVVSSDTDVYVAGYVYASNNTWTVPAYWKNGVLHKMADSSNGAGAESVVVHDTDVLVAATIEHQDNSAFTAVYYRNGQRVELADKAFVGMSHCAIFTDCGCDFYICGAMMVNGIYKAVYWKNGVAHLLPEKSPQSFALGISVRGGNVYVAGSAITTLNTKYAVYWKNDTAYTLADTLSDSEARDIALLGNDVYAAGYTYSASLGTDIAAYWKNGTPAVLSSGNALTSIATGSGNYYLSGNTGSSGIGIYWINGSPHNLPSTDYTPSADGIAVMGSDVYVAGWIIGPPNSDLTPAYWKNGNIVHLPAPTKGLAVGIAVVTH